MLKEHNTHMYITEMTLTFLCASVNPDHQTPSLEEFSSLWQCRCCHLLFIHLFSIFLFLYYWMRGMCHSRYIEVIEHPVGIFSLLLTCESLRLNSSNLGWCWSLYPLNHLDGHFFFLFFFFSVLISLFFSFRLWPILDHFLVCSSIGVNSVNPMMKRWQEVCLRVETVTWHTLFCRFRKKSIDFFKVKLL